MSEAAAGSLRAQVGALVRTHRLQSGLSQAELAEKAHLSTEFISRIERGGTSPSLDSLASLSTALKVPVSAFFFDPGDQKRAANSDLLHRMLVRLSSLDREELAWAEKLLSVALSRKPRRRAGNA